GVPAESQRDAIGFAEDVLDLDLQIRVVRDHRARERPRRLGAGRCARRRVVVDEVRREELVDSVEVAAGHAREVAAGDLLLVHWVSLGSSDSHGLDGGADSMSFSGAMIQNAIYIAQEPPAWPVAFEDWERAAEERLDPGAFGYIAGGAGAESTMRANLEAFQRWRIRPRMLTGNVSRDISVDVLGMKSAAPFFLAPIGVLSIAHEEAEIGAARAAAAAGVPVVLSSAAT